jgi:HK97 family phage prohead protease
MPDSFKPTAGMRSEAKRGLAWRKEFNRGGTAIGVARARDIVNGRELPLDTVKRMHSYFARHEVDKKGQGWSGGDGFPSAGRIAWALWGGDPGKTWAATIVERAERAGGSIMERRFGDSLSVATRGGKIEVLRGYASVTETPYPIGFGKEIIVRGAFARTLKERPDVVALWNHDTSMPIARTTAGNLRLSEDDRGLLVELEPIDTQVGRDARIAVRSGVVSAMSFGFIVRSDRFEDRDGSVHRMIDDLELHEVSAVTFPANPATDLIVDRRSYDRWSVDNRNPQIIRRRLWIGPKR